MPRSMTPRAMSLAENTDTVPPPSAGSSNTSGPVSSRTAYVSATAVTYTSRSENFANSCRFASVWSSRAPSAP